MRMTENNRRARIVRLEGLHTRVRVTEKIDDYDIEVNVED